MQLRKLRNMRSFCRKALAGCLAVAVCLNGLPVDHLGTVRAAGTPVARDDESIVYFVDCGDYTPDTVCEGDQLGTHNSVTDQAYGADPVTGYQWGIVDVEEEYPAQPGAPDPNRKNGTPPSNGGVYTANTWALEEAVKLDHTKKSGTNRYSKNFYEKGIAERFVDYAFELEAGVYEVTVGCANPWDCSNTPVITAKLENKAQDTVLSSNGFSVPKGNKSAQVVGNIAVPVGGDKLTVDVRGTGGDNLCVNVGYIIIKTVPVDVDADMAALTFPESVKVKLVLPASGETGSVITWSSSKPEILSDDGKVLKRPAYGESDAVVTMTASVSDGEVTKTKEFQVTVPALAEGEDPSLLLELSFNDNTLTDASIYEREVAAVGKANYTDGEGSNGRAFSFNNTYLDLGKESALTPEKLTVSFWLKPNADITGGQTIAWNKGAYNSDGWYLNLCPGGNTNIALGLSVGPGGGQPYYIQINKNANEFFPKTEWTHVAVTYDSDTKEAHFYRNGIPQKTTVGYALSDTATGVIGTNSNIKVIGSNGEEHKHGDKLNAALDEYCLYNRVLDAEEVIALYDKSGKTFDKQAAAQMELDALAIDTTEPLITEITLPEKGDFGSAITWSANGSKYLSDKGEVLERPAIGSADAGVTLTATASYLNGTPATKDFKVTVKAIQEGENPSLLLDLGFDDENLADKSVYSRKVRNVGDVAYVAGVDDKGKAVSLDGNTYLNLGTGNKLTPEILSLSFWIKPNADITGEQIIAWSKGAYNGDGWYLNVNKDVALGLSVGAGNSQPYFIQVDKKADEFFPKTEWTHIAVTYNSKTKKAMFYRNGIPQKATVKYPTGDAANGVIGTNSYIKVIGSNGEEHKHGGKLKAALDEYRLYDTQFTLEQVIAAYEESGRTLDKQAVAQQDIDALEVPKEAADALTLPAEGESGSVITWESNKAAIAINGTECTVTPPGYGEEDQVVTLTATAVFAGGTPATKEFPVTVKAKKADFSELEKAIRDAADYETEDAYTPESYQVFKDALKDANDVLANKASSQEAVDGAVSALEAAIDGLEVKADAKPNKALLRKAIETANAKHETLYTQDSWNAMQTALTEANRVNEDEDATWDDVNYARQALEEAIANLTDALALNLAFEDNLTDSSANAFEVAGNKAVTYTDGVKGKAVSLEGSTYLNLGTNGKLSPGKLSLSFWINPSQKMTGECAITWNKEQWYTDGWYLMSESDTTPLALSVGPAAAEKQPYMISVSGDRSKFFPAGEWTHILVAYDSDTKEAAVYRNGIPQNTSVKYGLSETSTGVIGPCEGKQKAIGYNGPNYKGAYLKAALDEYRLYDKPLGLEEAIEVYEMSGRSLDKQAVARGDINALNIPETVTGRLILPGKGESGSVITWKTSDSSVIALDGTVTRPEIGQPDQSVTLTATAIFAGGAAEEKPFTVTVKAKTEKKQDGILDCGIENVTLADSYLLNAAQKENDYLLSMTSKKFLYEFYRVSGLTPPTEEGYQGWERSNGTNFRGHTFGHYMSALSQAYVGAKNADEKAALLVQIRDAVEGLKECQDAYAEKKPASAGYVSAFRESILDQVDGSGTSDENVIVPWYNLHKVLAGLIDIYTFVDDKELAEGALDIAEGFGEYVFNRCSKLSDNTAMLRTEYGGMNEALYELYDITGNTHYKAAAEYFDEITLFNSLAANQDVLSGKHANTTIPKLTGALKRYTVMKNNDDYYDALTEQEQAELEKYKTAAVNFWDIVVEHHTYITGGNSQLEHFHDADKLYYDATKSDYDGSSTCETCNTYNMLKLSRELYKLTKDKKYMDYYENTYINAILSSQNPETGTTMYFQPMAPGYNKVFNRPHDEFWCCTGTGMENFSKLGDTMYFTEKSDVYVNMYFSNTYAFGKQNLKLTQKANIPNEDEVTVTVAALDGSGVAAGTNLKFRIPDWVAGEAGILVNNVELNLDDNTENGYVTVADVKAGDVIKLTFPMEVRAYATQDNKDFVAFRYGPVALSAALGTNNMEAYSPNGILVRVGTKDGSCQSVITVQNMSVDEWMSKVKENLVRIEDSEDGKVQFKLNNTDSSNLIYTPHFMRYKERYGLYMLFEEPGSEAGQKRIRDKKERLREEEMAIDSLTNFDENNSEFAKNLQYEKSGTGSFNGRLYRDAQKDGWFSYDMQINPDSEKNYLMCTWYSGDKGRSFDLYINGEKLQSIAITEDAGTNVFYTQRIEIPDKYWSEPQYKKDSTGEFVLDADGNKIPIVNVKFQSNGAGAGLVGGLYGIMTSDTLEYSHDPNLSSLTFDKGKLTPQLNAETKNYTLKVPSITKEVTMKVSPNTPSGLIFIDDILIDDSIGRRITLTDGGTEITFKASAQDHETMADYKVTIVRSTVDVSGLAGKLEEAEGIEKGNYTDESYAAFLKALEDVRGVIDDPDSTKEQVEAAQRALSEAIAGLKEASGEIKTDFTSLNRTIAEAKKLKASDYTTASYATFKKALSNAEKVASNAQATQVRVNAADTALKAAVKALVKLKVISTKKVTLGVKETFSVAAKGYTYATLNSKVASVSSKGKVRAKKTGKATIKATNQAGNVKVYNITVKKAPKKIVKVTPSKKTLRKGKTVKLRVKLPNGTAGKCTFKSNKPKVASVNSKGVVKAKKKGTAKITVRTYNKKKKVVTIKVR